MKTSLSHINELGSKQSTKWWLFWGGRSTSGYLHRPENMRTSRNVQEGSLQEANSWSSPGIFFFPHILHQLTNFKHLHYFVEHPVLQDIKLCSNVYVCVYTYIHIQFGTFCFIIFAVKFELKHLLFVLISCSVFLFWKQGICVAALWYLLLGVILSKFPAFLSSSLLSWRISRLNMYLKETIESVLSSVIGI